MNACLHALSRCARSPSCERLIAPPSSPCCLSFSDANAGARHWKRPRRHTVRLHQHNGLLQVCDMRVAVCMRARVCSCASCGSCRCVRVCVCVCVCVCAQCTTLGVRRACAFVRMCQWVSKSVTPPPPFPHVAFVSLCLFPFHVSTLRHGW